MRLPFNIEELLDEVEEKLDGSRLPWRLTSAVEDYVSELESTIEQLEDEIENLESPHKLLVDELKEEWWHEVKQKFTLPQLESIFGTRFNLKSYDQIIN